MDDLVLILHIDFERKRVVLLFLGSPLELFGYPLEGRAP